VYVRFLKADYVPQLDDDPGAASGYLLIGGELVEKQALEMTGIEYKVVPQGYFALDPACTYVSPLGACGPADFLEPHTVDYSYEYATTRDWSS
jgi:hypothetical protein